MHKPDTSVCSVEHWADTCRSPLGPKTATRGEAPKNRTPFIAANFFDLSSSSPGKLGNGKKSPSGERLSSFPHPASHSQSSPRTTTESQSARSSSGYDRSAPPIRVHPVRVRRRQAQTNGGTKGVRTRRCKAFRRQFQKLNKINTLLRRRMDGAPGRIRTCDLCLRRAALYPAELRVHGVSANGARGCVLHSLINRRRQPD